MNAWILAWDADRLLRFLSGDVDAIRNFWNANIFYPEPLTLAYSEHLFAQAVQILPVYALTGNVILSYNLLFLSTFVLSGLGMFLLVRDITGSARAGLVAGLIYAFAPYRVPPVFAPPGDFLAMDAVRPLRSAALFRDEAMRARSSVPAPRLWRKTFRTVTSSCSSRRLSLAYALFEIATRKLWTDTRVWGALSATAIVVTVLTLPFLLPYLELRRLGIRRRAP